MHDIRYAARLLRRQPRFALLAALTMALGIGATTTLFSISYGVLMKPLPWPSADRIVVLKETRGGNPPRFGSFTNTAYAAWREQASTIDDLAAWSQSVMTMSGAGDPDRIRVTNASASLFRLLGVRPEGDHGWQEVRRAGGGGGRRQAECSREWPRLPRRSLTTPTAATSRRSQYR